MLYRKKSLDVDNCPTSQNWSGLWLQDKQTGEDRISSNKNYCLQRFVQTFHLTGEDMKPSELKQKGHKETGIWCLLASALWALCFSLLLNACFQSLQLHHASHKARTVQIFVCLKHRFLSFYICDAGSLKKHWFEPSNHRTVSHLFDKHGLGACYFALSDLEIGHELRNRTNLLACWNLIAPLGKRRSVFI